MKVSPLLLNVACVAALGTCDEVRSTPKYGSAGAVFTVCTKETIYAPAPLVISILKDFDNYHRWNTFVVNVTKQSPGPYGVGTTILFDNARITPGVITKSTEEISIWEDDRVAWFSADPATPSSFLTAEHPSTVVSAGPGVAVYDSWETMYGPGAALVLALIGPAVQNAFVQQGKDLKAWAELQAQQI